MNERIENKLRKRRQKQKSKQIRILAILLFLFLIASLIVSWISNNIITVITVDGDSMQRTLFDGDKLLVKKIGINTDSIEVDDLIYFEGKDDKYYVKRVIGLPGDSVEIVSQRVLVNGIEKIEEYTMGDATDAFGQNRWILGSNEYFVLGDNRYRQLSVDSRVFGPISIDQIEGKVIHNFTSRD